MQNYNSPSTDIFGSALLDYAKGHYTEDIITYISLDETDVLSLPYLFRTFEEMPPLEQAALELCRGKVLDVGCGAGSHSLYLQQMGFDVTALDHSPGAIETCRIRGLKNAVLSPFHSYSGTKFDTILLLMHGIGMAETIDGLGSFLSHLKTLLSPGGQVLLDSSDIIYMFDQDNDGGYWIPGNVSYYGEVQFVTEYKGIKSEPFPWLYLDYESLKKIASKNNLTCELVRSGEHYDYLARLSLNS